MEDNICYELTDLVPQESQYSPIQPGWIRVLDLLNKPYDDEPLQCRLRQVKLQGPEADYVALSYVWGDDTMRFQMQAMHEHPVSSTISTGMIPLTESLYNALRDLRDCDEVQPKTFWIDQICIDQGNNDEKSHQVAQMGKVFEYAAHVWTYLGPEEGIDDETLDLLTRIYDHFEPLTRTSDLAPLDDEALIQNTEAFQMYSRMAREDIPPALIFSEDLFGIPGEYHYEFDELDLGILSGPWTSRLWLFQENVVNYRTSFLRGCATVSWETLILICKLSYVGLVPRVTATFSILSIARQRHFRHRHDLPNQDKFQVQLQNLLWLTRTLKCREPQDKIYAVLGIAMDAEQLNIYPDYTLSTAQVFTNLSAAFIKERLGKMYLNPLDSLSKTDSKVPLDPSYVSMPTWVCTYLDRGYPTPNHERDINASQTGTIGDSYELARQVEFQPAPEVGNGVLVVKGMRLDLTAERNLGTFPGRSLVDMFDWASFNQLLGVYENIEAFAVGDDQFLSRVFEALMMGRHFLDGTIEQAEREAAAAQAIRDILQLLRRAKSGDLIPDRANRYVFHLPVPTLPGGANSLARSFLEGNDFLWFRSLWITKDKHVCVAPNRLQKDDIAVILFGGQWVYYLRPVGDNFEYIGWGYIAGFMHGEPFQDGWKENVETFHII